MVNIEDISTFFDSRREAEQRKLNELQDNAELGFNVFSLISDTYHRENFHSEVISAILDVKGKHEGGNKYLLEFISFLNQSLKIPIDPLHYKENVRVQRERGSIDGRRDITIFGNDKHTILIENKINDAGDTNNQIPTYFDQLVGSGHTVDAIVYLTLSQIKEPNERTWKIDDNTRIEIKSKLISVRAYDGTPKDMWNGWLKECIEITTHIDTLSILRQYKKVIHHLTRKHMDHDFYDKLNQHFKNRSEDCQLAIGIKNTLDEYPKHIISCIYQHFKCDDSFRPFNGINGGYYLSDYNIAGYSFNTDIICDLNICIIDFSVRTPEFYIKTPPEKVLYTIGMFEKFKWNGERFEHKIEGDFIEFESKAINFLTSFLGKLKDKEDEIKSALS